MKGRLRFLLLTVCVFTLLSMCSCSRKKTDSSQITIGFSIDTLIIERWQRDCRIFVDTARQYGADVIVKNAANDEKEQIAQIEELIASNVDVLVIVPKNSDSLTEVLNKARSRNIPVISYDRLIRNADIALYCSIDSQKVGYLMAECLLEKYSSGSFYCILGSEEDYNMILVDKGIRQALSGSDVTVDVKYFTPEWNYDKAYEKMTSLLDKNLVPDAVICGNDAVAECVIRAVSEHKREIPVVGQDADISACRRIVLGTQTATVYKPIYELAERVAELACRLASGEDIVAEENITETIDNGLNKIPVLWLDPVLVDEDNMKSVIVDSGFHSEEEIYR